jgi:hypothetical protein
VAVQPDEPAPAKTCPSCHAELADDAVLCVLCGYHLGLGRHLGPESADEEEPAPAAEREPTEEEKRRRMTTIVAGSCVVVFSVMFFLPKHQFGKGAAPAPNPEAPTPPAAEAPAAPAPAAEPPGGRARLRPSRQRDELAKKLPEMSHAEIRQEFATLDRRTRSLLTRPYMLEKLKNEDLQADELKSLAELGAAMSPEAFDEALAQRFGEVVGPRQPWNPLGPAMFGFLSDRQKVLVSSKICDFLPAGAPIPAVLAWQRALSQVEASKLRRPVMETRPLETADIDRMASCLVLLRRSGKGCLGIVVTTGKEVTVLTHSLATPDSRNWDQYYGSTATSQWEARTAASGDDQWVPATASLTVYTSLERRGPVICRLLRFPATGLLAEAQPAQLAPETANVHYALLPSARFRSDKASSLPPPPGLWERLQVVPKSFMRAAINSDIGNAFFDEDGKLVALRGNYSKALNMAQVESCLLPDASGPRFEFVDDPEGACQISLDFFDPRHVVAGVSALIGPDASSPEFEKTLKGWQDKPGGAIPHGGEPLPVELANGTVTVQVPGSPEDTAPFLLQLRLELVEEQVRYLEPTVVYPTRRRRAAKAHWLGSSERQRYAEARREGTPLAMHHTVNGDTRCYGDVEVTDLSLLPSDLLFDADGSHFYAADKVGVRRIDTAGFGETVALPVPQGTGRLVGTSEGLLVETKDAGGKPQLLVVDPETLAKRNTIPLPSSPNHLLGDWQSPFGMFFTNQVAIVFHAGTGKPLQRVKMSEMMSRPAGLEGAPAEERILGACLDPAFRAVYVHGTFSLRRFPFSAKTGLNKPGERGVCRLAPGQPKTFGLRVDGEYAFAGQYVYDLRLGGKPVSMHAEILAMSPRTGHVVAAVDTRDRTEDPLMVLDRFGNRIGSWPVAAPYALGVTRAFFRHAIAHPDGRHFLVWNAHSVFWVAVPEAAGGTSHGSEPK